MTGPHPAGGFGPWTAAITPTERVAQFRLLAGLAALLFGSRNALVLSLRQAERDDVARVRALDLLNAAPALPRRRLIATFGAVMWAPSRPRPRMRFVAEPTGKFSDLPDKGEAVA
jgi:hypothetical protein